MENENITYGIVFQSFNIAETQKEILQFQKKG